jgi:uncharacterized repeat protein (TIGR04138 family)
MSREPKKSFEDVVAEVGRYPMDAFLFVQECIGLAADQVHGPMSRHETSVAKWMATEGIGPEELAQRQEEGGVPPDIAAALKQLGGPGKMNRHVSGKELCWALRDAALKRWGLMAMGVLARWGITRTQDIGAMIFALVENDWLKKQPTDSIHDFDDVYIFQEAFEGSYRIQVK